MLTKQQQQEIACGCECECQAKTKVERIKEMAQELKAMFPGLMPQVSVRYDGKAWLSIHRCGDYAQTTDLARSLGMDDRQKQVHNPDQPWFVLNSDRDGIAIDLFGSGLPSSCAVVKVKEKIPKQQTVDTGEFIEVERTKIVCGHPETVEAQ